VNNFNLELGGKKYTVKPLPIRPARALRKEIGAALDEPLEALKNIQGIELTDTDALADVIFAVKSILFDSIDTALDTVCGYCPEIKADRERIETEATDDEVVVAFLEVVKRLFPFGALTSMVSKITTGLTSKPT